MSKEAHIAIIGPNGSGKSSLIKIITKEYYPFAETEELVIKIMGKDRWNVFELRKLLGIVSGDLQQTYCPKHPKPKQYQSLHRSI